MKVAYYLDVHVPRAVVDKLPDPDSHLMGMDYVLIAEASSLEDWKDRICYLPL